MSKRSFTYDNQDRLTNFNDNNGSNSHIYDNRGRITTNSALGNYVYTGGSYQQTGLKALTPTATSYYQDRPLQQITYNAFKSPVEIAEQGKEKISFQYNAAMDRAHMYYGNEQADKMSRRYRRHYSQEGSMEITNDLQTGTTSFVFYMGGDAYSAPAIWKEVHTATQTTQNLYYLHRDHLGSILLITDNQGNIAEKRQFDAWGNVVKLTDGSGNALSNFIITDRGYTGHEHLLGVALIHMNGRLYDPLLHRFLSPDNCVQDPFNSQNFNRYGYVLNNPLSYNDPSGEFIPFLAIGIGAMIGAASGGAAYIGSAIRTGNWSWGQFGMSVLGGAAIGGLTGGINPMSILGAGSLGGVAASGFAAGLLPSANLPIGDFNFSISPAVAFGNSFGVGANLGVGYNNGKFSISGGVGVMSYGNYQGFGTSGTEIRASILAAYDNGKTGFSLGTNFWRGSGDMVEFNQRTTIAGFRSGKVSFAYENDGSPFSYAGKLLSNNTDMYRTAAVSIGVGNLSLQTNMFTGRSGNDVNGQSQNIDYSRGPNGYWANPEANKYRLGSLTVGYKGYRAGTNSEWVRNGFQNKFAHTVMSPQPGFDMLSTNWGAYFQYQTFNKYSLW